MIIKRSHFILALVVMALLLLSQQAIAGSQDLRRPATSTTGAAQIEPGGTLTFSPATQTINRRDTINRVRSSASIEHSLTATTTVTVTVGPGFNLTFVPATQTINQGDAVNWFWESDPFISHSTTSGTCSGLICTPDGKWNSLTHTAPFNYPVTFNTTGAFPYFCSVHLSFMQGTIVVMFPLKLFLPLILK